VEVENGKLVSSVSLSKPSTPSAQPDRADSVQPYQADSTNSFNIEEFNPRKIRLVIQLDSTVTCVNGNEFTLPVIPTYFNDTTYVPLSLLTDDLVLITATSMKPDKSASMFRPNMYPTLKGGLNYQEGFWNLGNQRPAGLGRTCRFSGSLSRVRQPVKPRRIAAPHRFQLARVPFGRK
jgi:hypothetical protein